MTDERAAVIMGGDRERGWIDVSVPLVDGMAHWPDNPPVSISRHLDREHGDACNVSDLHLGAHSGTHVDAPIHFVDGGKATEDLDVRIGMGPTRVVAAHDSVAITADVVRALDPRPGERIIFKTRNSPAAWRAGGFDPHAVFLEGDASQALADAGVVLVGIDYLSVGGYTCQNADAAHRPLLERGCWILEGLDLTAVEPGDYTLLCVPLLLVASDASPVRALLRPC